jgi:hypothetical protein
MLDRTNLGGLSWRTRPSQHSSDFVAVQTTRLLKLK